MCHLLQRSLFIYTVSLQLFVAFRGQNVETQRKTSFALQMTNFFPFEFILEWMMLCFFHHTENGDAADANVTALFCPTEKRNEYIVMFRKAFGRLTTKIYTRSHTFFFSIARLYAHIAMLFHSTPFVYLFECIH